MEKDFYIIRFETQEIADFWMRQFCHKFDDEVMSVNKQYSSVELVDSVYYFWNINRVQSRLQNNAIEYDADAIYIILDDPERKKYLIPEDESDTVTCDGCTHLIYNSDGSVECGRGLDSALKSYNKSNIRPCKEYDK